MGFLHPRVCERGFQEPRSTLVTTAYKLASALCGWFRRIAGSAGERCERVRTTYCLRNKHCSEILEGDECRVGENRSREIDRTQREERTDDFLIGIGFGKSTRNRFV